MQRHVDNTGPKMLENSRSPREMNTFGGLLKASIVSLIIIIAAYFLNYGTNLILARWLGVIVYGDYAAAISSLKITAMVVLLGMDYAVIRFIPEYVATADWHAASGYLRRSFALLVHIGAAVVVGGLLVAAGFYLVNKTGDYTFERHHPVFLFIWAIPFVALNTYFGKLLRGTRHIYLSLISLNIAQPVMFFLALSIVMLFGHEFNVNEAMFAFVISTILVLVWQAIAIYKALPPKIMHSEPRYESKMWMNVAIQLLITSFLTTNLNSLTIIISETFDANEQHVGLLSAIFTICNSLWLTYSAVMTVMSPLISPAVKQNDKARLQMLINVGTLTMMVGGVLLLITIVLWGDVILRHFGASFVAGHSALMIIASVFVFALMNGMSLPLLQYSGNQKIIIKITMVGTAMLVVFGGLLSHYFGLMGSVIAVCMVQVVMSIWCSYWVRKLFKIRPYILF